MGKISVILCCYNDGHLVSEALDSAFAQSIPPDQYEVIFVDDGSSDTSAQVASLYAGRSNFQYVRNERNLGLPAACNRGLAASTGDYITRLDADDVFAPTILEELRKPLDAGRGDFAYCDRNELVLQSNETLRIDLSEFNLFSLTAAATLMRRSLLLNIEGYRDMFWEEYDLYLRYLTASGKEPIHVPKALYTYTIRSGSMTQDPARVTAGWDELKRAWPKAQALKFGLPPQEANW